MSKRLFWGIPMRLAFEFYFILALTAWHNMTGPRDPDASRITAYIVLVILIGFTIYIYYSWILASCV